MFEDSNRVINFIFRCSDQTPSQQPISLRPSNATPLDHCVKMRHDAKTCVRARVLNKCLRTTTFWAEATKENKRKMGDAPLLSSIKKIDLRHYSFKKGNCLWDSWRLSVIQDDLKKTLSDAVFCQTEWYSKQSRVIVVTL